MVKVYRKKDKGDSIVSLKSLQRVEDTDNEEDVHLITDNSEETYNI